MNRVVSGTIRSVCVSRRVEVVLSAYMRVRVVGNWWRVWQPLHVDSPSRPSLLLGNRAGTDLACTSYVTGFGGFVGGGEGEEGSGG